MKRSTIVIILCIAVAASLCGCQIIKGGPRRGYLSEQDTSEHMLKEIIQYNLRGQSGGIYKRIDQARTERIKNRQFSPRHSFKKDMVADSEMW